MKKLIRSSTEVKAATKKYQNYYRHRRGGFSSDFAIHYNDYGENPEYFECQVSEIHPYDDAEYAWARKDSPTSASVFKGGKLIDTVNLPEWDEDSYEDATEYVNEIIDILCTEIGDINSNVEPRIIHN